jgi:hypothetical protein
MPTPLDAGGSTSRAYATSAAERSALPTPYSAAAQYSTARWSAGVRT